MNLLNYASFQNLLQSTYRITNISIKNNILYRITLHYRIKLKGAIRVVIITKIFQSLIKQKDKNEKVKKYIKQDLKEFPIITELSEKKSISKIYNYYYDSKRNKKCR